MLILFWTVALSHGLLRVFQGLYAHGISLAENEAGLWLTCYNNVHV